MTNLSENILDLDQLKDEPLEIPEVAALNKTESSVKERKKPGRKKGSSQRLKGLGNPLLLAADGPKLSREEKKALQLQELFDKMEQKEKRKEDNIRKKRKLNSERSPNLSVTQAESQEDEGDRPQQEDGNNMSPKSDMRSPVRERTPVSKKSEPVKVNSKYFNSEFELSGSKNLIAYLYEYQKEYGKKFGATGQNKVDIGTDLFSKNMQTPEGSLVSMVEPEKLNQFNNQLKQQNEKLVEHLKNYEQLQATKDLRHAFYNYDYK